MNISPALLALAETFRRPSNVGRIADCNGQPLMAAAVVAEDGMAPAAPEADLGTNVHGHVCAGVLLWKDGTEWSDAIAHVCADAARAGLDSWSIHCIGATLDFYRGLIEQYDIERENVLPEVILDMAGAGFQRKGTADLVLVIPFRLLVIVDLKAGFVDQGDAADHDQMAVYAAAGAATFKTGKVVVYLWQPRAERDRRATCAEFDAAALHDTTTWSLAVLWRSRQPTAELCAGFNQCATCPALRRCPAAKAYIMNAQEALAVLGKPSTPEAWGEAIGAAKLAEKWAEAWKVAGKAHLQAGGQANGFKLGMGRAIRTVADVPGAFLKLRAAGMEAEALHAMAMTPGDLPPAAAGIIAEHITEGRAAPSLVADKCRGAA